MDVLQVPELAKVCCTVLNPDQGNISQGPGIRILRRVNKLSYEIMKKQIKKYNMRCIGNEDQASFSTTERVLNGVSLSELSMRAHLQGKSEQITGHCAQGTQHRRKHTAK